MSELEKVVVNSVLNNLVETTKNTSFIKFISFCLYKNGHSNKNLRF